LGGDGTLAKAIRRGRTDLALQAAATLLIDAPERLCARTLVEHDVIDFV
jgi:hypothetical protein